MHAQINSRGKAGKEIPEPSRLGFLEKNLFIENNFDISNVEDNTYLRAIIYIEEV